MASVFVIIPAYNEEKTVGSVVKAASGSLRLAKFPHEILVVDDGSSDGTAAVARKAGAKVVSFAKNRGLTAAFKKGIEVAVSRRSDIIVNIDADMQHDPKDIPKLVGPIKEGKTDVVIGSRFMGEIEGMSGLKYIGNIAFTKLINLFTGERLTDAQSGFRAFSREVAEKMEIQDGYTYTQQMIVSASNKRFKIIEVPIKASKRNGESKLVKNPFSFARRAMSLLVLVVAKYHPLKFFSFCGLMMAILGLGLGYASPERNVLSSLLISSGITLLLFGVLFRVMKER